MKSMTGYGRARQVLHGRTVTVELRAVNHRYLDCTVKAPRQFGFLDDAVKKAAAARIARGKTEIYVSVETDEGGDLSVTVNHALAERYLTALRELSEKYGLRDDVTVMSLAKMPGCSRFRAHRAGRGRADAGRSDRLFRGVRRLRPDARARGRKARR